MSKYLDSNGVLYLWGKLKALVNTKVTAVEGKQLSANDYTDTEKNKLSGIAANANNYAHPTGDGNQHVPATGTGNNGKFLRAGSTAGSAAWGGLTREEITALGIPGSDTTYNVATASADGLMAKEDKAKLDAFGAASTYALKSDITSMYRYKGSVAAVANLPSSNNTTGDVYDVQADGMNYAWNGTAWDALGSALAVEAITNAEIDAIAV